MLDFSQLYFKKIKKNTKIKIDQIDIFYQKWRTDK